jgi:hypothetical protein
LQVHQQQQVQHILQAQPPILQVQQISQGKIVAAVILILPLLRPPQKSFLPHPESEAAD